MRIWSNKTKSWLSLCALTVVLSACGGGGGGGSSSIAPSTPPAVANGELDVNFNGVGYNTMDVGNEIDSANAVSIASDGSIYLAGYSRNPSSGNGYDIALWHYTSDGLLDTGFQSGGYTLLVNPAGGGGNKYDYANDMTLDANGKPVVVGHSINAAGDDDMVLARFNTDGSLDTTFGGNAHPADSTPDGFTVVNVSGTSADEGDAVAVDSSGKIYVAGTSNAAGDNDLMLWRFTSSGALDTTFNNPTGYISYDSGGVDTAKGIAIDANGKLLVTGQASGQMVIWRVTSNGADDTGFNGTGIVLGAAPGTATGSGITTDADGNIVVAGDIVISGNLNDMALWRYTSSGTLDTSFASPNGYVTHDGAAGNSNDYDYGIAVTIDAAGNILVAGKGKGTYQDDMVVWRYTKAGVLDDTFGGDFNPADGTPDGFFVHNSAAGGSGFDQGKAITIDSQARVVVGGDSASSTNGPDVAIWRLK